MQYWCELCVFDLLQLIRELNLLSLLSKLAFAAQSLAIPTPEDFYLFALCSPLTRVLDSPGDLGTCICGRGGGAFKSHPCLSQVFTAMPGQKEEEFFDGTRHLLYQNMLPLSHCMLIPMWRRVTKPHLCRNPELRGPSGTGLLDAENWIFKDLWD